MADEFTAKFKVDISDLKKNISEANKEISRADKEFKNATAGMGKWSSSADGLSAKLKQLDTVLTAQKSKLEDYKQQLERQKEGYTENGNRAEQLKAKLQELADQGVSKTSEEYKKYQAELKSVVTEQQRNEAAIEQLNDRILDQDTAVKETQGDIKHYESVLSQLNAEQEQAAAAANKQQSAYDKLQSTINSQESELNQLKSDYKSVVLEQGENSDAAKKLASQIESLSGELKDNQNALENADKAADSFDSSMDEVGDSLDEAGDSAEEAESKLSILAKGALLKIGAMAAEAAINGLKAFGKAIIDVGKQAVQGYADYEQLVGGVETLFGTGGQSLEEYAKSVGKSVSEAKGEYKKLSDSQDTVLKNASNAFKTAGMSANDYMETVTGFSASLIQSLGGDTSKAASYADRAIIDMSDNANKMGTDISSIQSAYQGFAKQNYNMLDNLKLGYGGTKEEMERLVKDASQMTDVQKKLGVEVDESSMSFGNIVNAISVMQESLGIAGTTSKEASETISGSIGSMKAAWDNLLVGIASGENVTELFNDFADSVQTVLNNLIPVISQTMTSMVSLITQNLPTLVTTVLDLLTQLVNQIPDLLSQLLPGLIPTIIEQGVNLLMVLAQALIDSLPILVAAAFQLAEGILNGLSEALPLILDMVMTQLIPQLILTITAGIPGLLQAGVNLLMALVDAIPVIIQELVPQMPTIIEAIVQALVQSIPILLEAGIELLRALVQAIPQIQVEIIAAMPDIVNAIIDGLSGLGKGIWDAITHPFSKGMSGAKSETKAGFKGIQSEFSGGGRSIENSVTNTNAKILSSNTGLMRNLQSGAAAGLNGVKDTYASTNAAIEKNTSDSSSKILSTKDKEISNYKSKTKAGLDAVKATYTANNTQIEQSASQSASRVVATKQQELQQFNSATKSGLSDTSSAYSSNTNEILSSLKASEGKFTQEGKTMSSNLANGVKSGAASIKSAAISAVSGALSGINGQRSGFSTAGYNMMAGVTAGLNSGSGSVYSTVAAIGRSMLARFKASLKEASPSKATKEMGKFLIEGLEIGMTDEQGKAEKMIDKLGERLLSLFEKNKTDYKTAGSNLITSFNDGVTKTLEGSKKRVENLVDDYFEGLIDENEKKQKDLEKQQKDLEKQIKATNAKTAAAQKTALENQKKEIDKQLAAAKKQGDELSKVYSGFGKEIVTEFDKAIDDATKGVTDKLTKNVQALQDKMQSELNAVYSKISSMQGKLSGYGGLFETVKDGEESKTVVKNLKNEIATLKSYAGNLNMLKHDFDAPKELLAEIANMNVDEAISFSDELIAMSSKQRERFFKDYETKQKLAKSISKNYYADEVAEIKNNYTDKITAEFKKAEKEVKEIGKRTAEGFIKGLKETRFDKSIRGVAKSLISIFKKELGIKSPSRVFRDEIGVNSALGIEVGFNDEMKSVSKNMARQIRQRVGAIESDLSLKSAAGQMVGATGITGGTYSSNVVNREYNFTQVINAPKQPSRLELYRQTKNLLKDANSGVV